MSISKASMVKYIYQQKASDCFKMLFKSSPENEEDVCKHVVHNIQTLKRNQLYFVQGQKKAYIIIFKTFNVRTFSVKVIAGVQAPIKVREKGISRFAHIWLRRTFIPITTQDFPLYLSMSYQTTYFEDVLNGTRTSLKGV